MTPALWIELGTFVAAMILGCFTLVRYINAEDSTVIRDSDTKIGRAYQRIDEVKDKISANIKDLDGPEGYVRKGMCKVLHDATALNLVGLENRIEKRFDKLEELIGQQRK